MGNNIGFYCCLDKTNSPKFTSIAPSHGGTDSPSRKYFMGTPCLLSPQIPFNMVLNNFAGCPSRLHIWKGILTILSP